MGTKKFKIVLFLILTTVLCRCNKSSPTEPSKPSLPAPVLSSIDPTFGPEIGGTIVKIYGSNFASGAKVTFGGVSATGVSFSSSTFLTATTPAHSPGEVDVVVTNPDGQSGRLTNGFNYFSGLDVNGSWEGTTAAGAIFKFYVSNVTVENMTLKRIPGCPPGDLYWWTTSCPVNNNAFDYSAPSNDPLVSGTVKGTFSSATTASGSMNLKFKSGCANVHKSTWTATKK